MYTYIYFIIIYRQGPAARLDAAGALEALGRKDAVLAVVVLVADGDGERQQNAAAHVGNLGHFDCQQRHGGRVSFIVLAGGLALEAPQILLEVVGIPVYLCVHILCMYMCISTHTYTHTYTHIYAADTPRSRRHTESAR